MGQEAKSSGLRALFASKSIPDLTRTPYGAHRIPQGEREEGEPVRRSRQQDGVKGDRLESAAMQSAIANSHRR
jgi:hypothetical protein